MVRWKNTSFLKETKQAAIKHRNAVFQKFPFCSLPNMFILIDISLELASDNNLKKIYFTIPQQVMIKQLIVHTRFYGAVFWAHQTALDLWCLSGMIHLYLVYSSIYTYENRTRSIAQPTVTRTLLFIQEHNTKIPAEFPTVHRSCVLQLGKGKFEFNARQGDQGKESKGDECITLPVTFLVTWMMGMLTGC